MNSACVKGILEKRFGMPKNITWKIIIRESLNALRILEDYFWKENNSTIVCFPEDS